MARKQNKKKKPNPAPSLPAKEWFLGNGYDGLAEAMEQRPELFAHIPQEEDGENVYIFTHRGMVQLWQQGKLCGMLVATNRAAAATFAKRLSTGGRRISVAAIGSVQGETLDMQFEVAKRRHGATGLCVTEDGQTFHFLTPA